MSKSTRPKTLIDVSHIDALPLGTRLAEFEILSLLGVGGFGMVYEAFDHSLHRAVAIKEYMPATLAARVNDGVLWVRATTDRPAFQAGLDSFVNEARMLAQFDHPSLVKVFRFWEANNTAYMVMPRYDGMTLKQARTHMRTPPPEAWLRKLLWSVLSALRVLHDASMLHRDISPENIFLQDTGPPVLLDLGASRYAINDRDTKHTAVLKVNFAPIEQYSDGTGQGTMPLKQGPWSDLYSLGAMVHGVLCNDAPLPATLRALRDRMVPFERVAHTVEDQFGEAYSDSFVDAISESLKLQPEERPQSIDAFLLLLGMSAPPAGMEHFDFRAELGGIWHDPVGQPNPPPTGELGHSAAIVAPMFAATAVVVKAHHSGDSDARSQAAEPDVLQPEDYPDNGPATIFLEDERRIARDGLDQGTSASTIQAPQPIGRQRQMPASHTVTATPVASAPLRSQPTTKSKARKKKWWLLAAVVALIVASGASIGLRETPIKQPVAASQLDKTPPAGAQAVLTEGKPSGAEAAAAASSSRESQSTADAAQKPEQLPAFVLADELSVASVPARSGARKKAAPAAEPAPQTAVPILAPPTSTSATPQPRPVVTPAPARTPILPRVLCGDNNVLTRSSCLRAECRTPANRSNPACVEFRKAMEPLELNQFAN